MDVDALDPDPLVPLLDAARLLDVRATGGDGFGFRATVLAVAHLTALNSPNGVLWSAATVAELLGCGTDTARTYLNRAVTRRVLARRLVDGRYGYRLEEPPR